MIIDLYNQKISKIHHIKNSLFHICLTNFFQNMLIIQSSYICIDSSIVDILVSIKYQI